MTAYGTTQTRPLERTTETSLEWMTIVEGLIGDYYQQTDPVDDIDRIYRQQEVEEWLDLLEAYSRGEAGYNDLLTWQPDYLRDIDGFNDYLDGIRTQVTWERNANYNIEYCEENGCRDADMQRFYDKWVRSGQPTTKDGMLSDEDFDKYTAVPNEVDGIVEILRNEGYSDEDIQDLLDSIVDNDDFYGSTVLSNVLRDLGYYEAGEQWDVSPRPGSPCTAEDGTIGQYDNAGGCVSRGIGSEGDPCGYRGEGQKDASGNCVGGEENCDNPTYAADYVEDCSEFGVCEDGTLKTDEDGTNCSEYVDPLTDEDKLVRDYGQEAVDKAKEIYNGIEDWVEGTIEDPIGALKNILDTVYSGMPEECKESTTNKPDDWWKDCTNLSVLGQIPGLPIPLPPGTIDVNTTIRDLENAAKEAGKTLEDIFNPTCTGTPAEIQECENRTISDIIGDWASDIWDDIKGAWEDLEDKTEQGLLNILIDAGYNILSGWIFTQVKDAVTLDDPLALVPLENCIDQDWLDQASPDQKALCNDVVNCEDQGLTGGWVRDVDLCGPPIHGYCNDNATVKDDAKGTNCEEYSEFGFCEDGTKKADELGTNCKEYSEFGFCADGTKKVDELGTNCKEYSEFGFCEDEVTKKVDAEGTNCKENSTPIFDCSSVKRNPPEGGGEATSVNDCGSCIDTSLEPNNVGNCEEPAISQEEQDCIDKGRVWDGVTETCEENCVNTQHVVDPETGECGPEPFVNTGPDEATCAGRGKSFVPADETTDPPTPSSCGDCVEEGWTHDGVGTNCVDPDPDPYNCAGLGKTLNEDKSCGPCTQEGFTDDGPNGECVAPKECKEGNEDITNEVTETLPYGSPIPRVTPTYEDDGTQCVKTITNYVVADPTQAQCEESGKELSKDGKTCVEPDPDPYDCASQGKNINEDKSCGECTEKGWTSEGEGLPCTAPPKECQNGAVNPEACDDCGDNTAPSDHEGGDCTKPLLSVGCSAETYTAERTVTVTLGAGQTQESTVQYVDENGVCTKVTTVYQEGPTPPPETQLCGDNLPPEGEECVECPAGSAFPNASSLEKCGNIEPPECNAETATSQVNLTETIPFGDPIPDPVTTYEDDGTQCVATTTTYVEGPNPCATIDGTNFKECGYKYCGSGVYVLKDEVCGDTGVCEGDGVAPKGTEGCHICADNTPMAGKPVSSPEACGEPIIVDPECVENPQTDEEKLACGYKRCTPDGPLVPKDTICNGPPGVCNDPEANNTDGPLPCTFDPCPDGQPRDENNKCPGGLCNEEGANNVGQPLPCTYDECGEGEADFGNTVGCEKPCPDNANIGISDVLCGDNKECLNGATDYPECTTCADGSLPDADLGCGVEDPCDDEVYAAENPEECNPGVCEDCDCPAYAEANPEECSPEPPPPPPPEGGGGGGGFAAGERDPLNIGVTGDPEFKQRLEFPITDYLTGLFTGRG